MEKRAQLLSLSGNTPLVPQELRDARCSRLQISLQKQNDVPLSWPPACDRQDASCAGYTADPRQERAVDPAVVACALMMHFDHERCSDIEAKSKFGVAATTDVRLEDGCEVSSPSCSGTTGCRQRYFAPGPRMTHKEDHGRRTP